MAKPNSTKNVLNWMHSSECDDLPADVRQMGELALYDGIGCALPCSMLPITHKSADFAKVVGGPTDCTVIGFPVRNSVLNAALVNGTLNHADEVDAIDDFNTRGSHVLAASMAAEITAGQLV